MLSDYHNSIRKYIFFSTSQPVWWFVGLRCWPGRCWCAAGL